MTEAERQALIEDISNAVITRLNQNSVDWSSNTITFGDRYDIQVNERQNIKIPAIDKRNGTVYGNLDLNTLLTAYGLTQAMKSVESVEDAAETVRNELNSIIENLEDYLPIAGGEMTGPIDMNGNNISDVSKVQSIVSDGASAETIFAPYYSYSTLGVPAGDYQSFFMAWLKKMATLYPNIKASIIGQATPAYRSFIVCYMQSTSLTADGYPKYASGMFFSYKENEAYHFLFDNGTFKMNKVVTGDVYNKSEVDNLIANAGGDVDLSGYLPLAGGTMTGSVTLEGATLNKPLIVKGGDSASAGKIIFGENGQITNEATATLVGRIGESFYIGHSTYPVYLRGKNIRPYYNTANNTLALSSDIPTSASQVGAYTKEEVDSLVANVGGGGSSESTNKALRIIAGSEDSGDKNSFNINSDAELDAFIETSIVKWAKYRSITNGLPNGDGLVQAIGWRSPLDGSGWGRQIAYDDESHNIYSRYLGNGSWSAWKKVLVDGDSAPASDVYAWAKASSKPSYSASEVGAVPTSRTVNGKALTGNISLSASDVGASKVSYLSNSTTIPAMSVGELKIVGYSAWGSGANFKLPSGGSYYIVGVEEYEDSTIEDWVGMGINGIYSGGNTISTGGYHPWILVYRIS